MRIPPGLASINDTKESEQNQGGLLAVGWRWLDD
jgi:hypothetical protein